MWSVRFEDVTKRYRKGEAVYTTLGSEFREISRRIGSRVRGKKPEPIGKLALDQVSFEIQEGESFALVGANGAGKSTALRLLARISPPTNGIVRGRGRVGALMEVGSGVHTELSGRENIWLYGSILGIPRSEIKRRFDEIVAFAELEQAIDTPVKFYSTGMRLRLGFAIASHLEPDIFAVDEALSVGDARFQEKCVNRMSRLVKTGTTVLFVSHDLASVESVCDRAIMIDQGREVTQGPVKDVLATYLNFVEQRRIEFSDDDTAFGTTRIKSATCHGLGGDERYRFAPHEGIELRLQFRSDQPIVKPHVSVRLTAGRQAIIECSMLEDGEGPSRVGQEWECVLRIDALPLRPRIYEIWVEVQGESAQGQLMDWIEVGSFRVEAAAGSGPKGVTAGALGGPVDVPYGWTVRS